MSPTLFISDLHLDPSRPTVTELFVGFMATRARQAAALYILGDLFEAWIGDDDPEPAHGPVIEAIHALVASGVPVYFMHGNRDFLIGTEFAARSGCTLLTDPTRIDLCGTPTLLLHGDSLCTDDQDYQAFRAMVREPQWQQQFVSKPVAERLAIAQQLRAISKESTQAKAEYIMDANPDTVLNVLRETGVERIIHGHTHRPAVHQVRVDGREAQRFVLGDWYEQGSLLVCDEQGCRLEVLPL